MRLAIVGGGAAGCFLAAVLTEMVPGTEVTIYERARRVLAKVEVSGGGRCNLTNTFADVDDLRQVYPRGANLMKRLMKRFGHREAYEWFERHGVPLVAQEDGCVFPVAQDSHAVTGCLMGIMRRNGVQIRLGHKVEDPKELLDRYDAVAVTIGGTPRGEGCVPSLFAFNVKDPGLNSLTGTVVPDALVSIPGTRFRTQGDLLITHWGLSGPAVLKLSSHAARHLAQVGYKTPLTVNWTGQTNAEVVRQTVDEALLNGAQKMVAGLRLFNLPQRLWSHIVERAGLQERRAGEVGKRGINRLTEVLVNDAYAMDSRCRHKEEFVTCGGVPLEAVDSSTLESKTTPRLFYAGEVLDIDGVTGGFNLQAAWTTAYAVALALSPPAESR